MPPEHIAFAAIRHAGRVYAVARPGRHHDVIRAMAVQGFGAECMIDQGFVTEAGRYVDRAEAMSIARAAGQLLSRACDGVPFQASAALLYSEDCW